ncbi:uncharacterized protein PG998_004863 [Apiospora kogelbergensis]|uniref:uncharacterized protein n=1 Tax=Apiospora kogelbergensis TaxID=1337665 RepID=UPI003131D850
MVGKSWTDAEETYFWRHVVPYSHSRAGRFRANEEITWEVLATGMTNHFKPNPRRRYSHAVLYEHWFLNMQIRTKSPNAEPHLTRYIRRAGISNPFPFSEGANNSGRPGQAAVVTADHSEAPSAQVADNSGAAASSKEQGVASSRTEGDHVPGITRPCQPNSPARTAAGKKHDIQQESVGGVATAQPLQQVAGEGLPARESKLYGFLPGTRPQGNTTPSQSATSGRTLLPSAHLRRTTRSGLGQPAALEDRRQEQLGRTRAQTRAQEPSSNLREGEDEPAPAHLSPNASRTGPYQAVLHPREAQRTEYQFGSSTVRRTTKRKRTATKSPPDINYVDSNESSTSDSDDIPARIVKTRRGPSGVPLSIDQ